MTDKVSMLAAMLAGKPTKESEAIRKIAEKVEGGKTPTSHINEQNYGANLPSAQELNISKVEALNANVQGLPPVSADELDYFFGDKKGQQRPKKTSPKPTENYYTPAPQKQIISEDQDRFDDVDMIQALKNKRLVNTQQTPIKNNLQDAVITPDLKKIVENMVYDILAEIVGEANQNLVNKEQIKIMIGESIFVGNIQQALVMPDKK